LEEKYHKGDIGVDDMIILTMILRNIDLMVWIGLIWLI
jgi:hypothetical protein